MVGALLSSYSQRGPKVMSARRTKINHVDVKIGLLIIEREIVDRGF